MKYIAVFDIPDGYGIGCASAKIAPKGKDIYVDGDFENTYAQVEPLSKDPTAELSPSAFRDLNSLSGRPRKNCLKSSFINTGRTAKLKFGSFPAIMTPGT